VKLGLVIAGNPRPGHVGRHLLQASSKLQISAQLWDTERAFAGPWIATRLSWHLRSHQPLGLRRFGEEVVAACRSQRANCLIATGIAPLDRRCLRELGEMGVRRLNFLTDDPWNPAHRAQWFFGALDSYDHVFSPRQANLEDLRRLGCPEVSYLPFAYAEDTHFPSPDQSGPASDVMLAGNADRDRLRWVAPLIDAGFQVDLYGRYWKRYRRTRAHARGSIGPHKLRIAVAGAKVALCLTRQANRDGHAMRSYELPAMGACLLVEDTSDHRQLFGREGESVLYFTAAPEMVEKAKWLTEHAQERRRLASSARMLILKGCHTYTDRLSQMLARQ
jgi:spore maturation protein CgeB